MTTPRGTVRVIGDGRAGGSFAAALRAVGWDVDGPIGRDRSATARAAHGADLVLVCVGDAAVAEVAAAIEPGDAVVAHCAGSLGLDALAPHGRRASVHPLVSLPDATVGAARLADGAWFAVAGDPIARQVVEALGGRTVEVDDAHRAAYHAAACIAANHLVALLGQVARVAASIDVPFEAYLDLARGALDNVAALGPAAALTGPAARGDEATIARHLDALDPSEHAAYRAMADEARRLAATRSD